MSWRLNEINQREREFNGGRGGRGINLRNASIFRGWQEREGPAKYREYVWPIK